ncbi:CinA family protein [Microbacterium sediminicola]|uniref:CinA family protein n=1 Tax=Microbacterium sediminicola TaxID=415210 RepID=A0ABP4U3M6_9MICO
MSEDTAGPDIDSRAADLLPILAGRGWRIATAESLTGGLLASAIVSVPGASAVMYGGVVAYATEVKHTVLGVEQSLLAREGAVHPDVALQMARGVRVALGPAQRPVEVGVATTGVAGPDPQDGAPVGRVYVAVVTPQQERVVRLDLDGDRAGIRCGAVEAALELVRISL